MNSIYYNTQHSPIGASASFTLGARGAKGGLAIELGKPADQNVFIGLEDEGGGTFSCLPFFDAVVDESTRFDVSESGKRKRSMLRAFKDKAITRTLSPQRDTWGAGDLRFSIHSPVCPAPEPGAPRARQMLAYVPALTVEMTVDNRRGKKSRRAFFGYQGNDPYRQMRRLDDTARGKFTGIACGDPYGSLIRALKTHLKAVLRPGICLFPDGGWKLSSTSDNSWLSKVYLCQFVAETILGLKPSDVADKAHANWLLDEKNHYWAWSDQILAGHAVGSKYYPRGVTSILWLRGKKVEPISNRFLPPAAE